jgi:hypothetical protein
LDKLIRESIIEILESRKDLLQIVVRQKAKFEGWLKFELAHKLKIIGLTNVEVETKNDRRRDRSDISFYYNDIL